MSVMSEWRLDPVEYANQVALARYTGPLNPRSCYWEPRTLECGHSDEDCDGVECGRVAQETDPNQVTDADVDWSQDGDREFFDQEFVDWLGCELTDRWEDR